MPLMPYLESHGLVGHFGHARVEEGLGVGEPEDRVGDIHVPGGGGRGRGEKQEEEKGIKGSLN